MRISLKAPAKINLLLRVLGRRSDGYHELVSIIHLVSLYDDLVVSARRRGVVIRVEGADLPEGPGNLVYDAAQVLARAAGVTDGASIRLVKRIPLGGGLGGGSSDAATTLIALNRLWGLQWSRARLAALGATLGSDIPGFLCGACVRVTGRGERVAPYPIDSAWGCRWVLLVNPGISVSTRWAFEALRMPLLSSDMQLTNQISIDTIPRSPGAPAPFTCPAENTLEVVTAAAYPVIDEMKGWLRSAGARVMLMSGSGATVFGMFLTRAAAAQAHARLPPAWTGWVVRLLRRAPW